MIAAHGAETGSLHRRWSDDDLVILHPVFRGKRISTFGDDVWVMDSLVERSNTGVTDLHFEGMSGERKLTAKELMATRLNFPCVSSRRDRVVKRYSPLTVNAMLNALKAVYAFMTIKASPASDSCDRKTSTGIRQPSRRALRIACRRPAR